MERAVELYKLPGYGVHGVCDAVRDKEFFWLSVGGCVNETCGTLWDGKGRGAVQAPCGVPGLAGCVDGTLQEAELAHCSLLTAHALITVVCVCVNRTVSFSPKPRQERTWSPRELMTVT